jgi:hypothetical protein
MMKKSVKIICTLLILTTMVLPTSALARQKQPVTFTKQSTEIYNTLIHHTVITPAACIDFDPLNDNITITVTINEIRALKMIDRFSNPDFYVKVKINDQTFISDIWENMQYVEHLNWSASCVVPKDKEFVNVSIELWDKNTGFDRLCDISPDYGNYTQARTAELTYSIATGIWWGDDYLEDPSGYGRLNGCDDNSIHEPERDCELFFTVSQNDFDGDGLPYWLEVNMYNTSPLINNRGEDADNDGIPIEWEYTFGLTYIEWGHEEGYYFIYDPFHWENYTALDEDEDGLNDIEEYKAWQWGSDPFRQDMFIEIDQMAKGPNGEGAFVPVQTYDMLRTSYAKHNIFWHIDDGRLGGGEIIPFKENIEDEDLDQWYMTYFMHGDIHNWRRGVFHWAIITYNGTWAKGFAFSSRINGMWALDCFLVSTSYHEMRSKIFPIIDGCYRRTFNRELNRACVYAGAMMHETGHTLGLYNPGVDNSQTVWPWQTDFWRFGPYKSVMNYRYIYNGVNDYSDGSHGKNDFDDWSAIDLTLINPRIHW